MAPIIIIFFAGIVSLVLALVHVIVYKAFVSIFSLTATGKLFLGIILAALCLSFVLASILTFNFNNLFTRTYYTISATWLGFAFYLFLASCIYVLTILLSRIFGIDTPKLFGILCLVLALAVSIYGVVHARTLLVKNINVTLPNLPAGWQGKRVVFVSDIHLGVVLGRDFAQKIVDKINEINPDIVFIGGDLYDGVKVDENQIVQPFAGLHPALGTYFITGNHEEFRDNKPYLEAVKNIGIRVLNNELVNINGLQLIGVDDRDSVNLAKFQNILANLNINKNEPSILLKHEPFQLDEAARVGISMQISGHTHRAQVFPLNGFTYLIYKGYDYGLHLFGKMSVYTSSGVGTWGPPLRVGSDSEIVVFTFS
ncbi:metallophosphoesterase [Candidatus Nomurabacteria bacterium]|nr:metallophosphoesterase [Candidatus Nomurabacteria bacterium]